MNPEGGTANSVLMLSKMESDVHCNGYSASELKENDKN